MKESMEQSGSADLGGSTVPSREATEHGDSCVWAPLHATPSLLGSLSLLLYQSVFPPPEVCLFRPSPVFGFPAPPGQELLGQLPEKTPLLSSPPQKCSLGGRLSLYRSEGCSLRILKAP